MDNIRTWFGERVNARRTELGLTQAAAAAGGGPSYATFYNIERTEGSVGPATLKKLDRCLFWAPGSAARAYSRGVSPEELDPVAAPTEQPATPDNPRETFEKLARRSGIQAAAFRMAALDDGDLDTVNDLLRSLLRRKGLPEDP